MIRTVLTAGLIVATAGCSGGGAAGYDPEDDTSVYDAAPATETFDPRFREDYQAEANLPDGRKVRLWYSRSGDRLLEQHYSPTAGAWTSPRVIHESSESDPCQGIDIVEEDGVVAVIADFGTYCYDGDPPNDSIAAVTTGDLTDWAVDATEGFDGWQTLTLDDGRAQWRGSGRSLTWTLDDGFSGGGPAGD